ncbi:acyl-CoA dehydrogenase family protein [Nocardioides sp. NPDC051685]|uniref:acyl-CoA dehydrogenase family protein n=1 Tax=Nocardioides sp. NPDC051685 TaxID=3364334 RepID=UPI0037999B65
MFHLPQSQRTADAEVIALVEEVMADWSASHACLPGVLDRELWQHLARLGLDELTSTAGGTWVDSVALLRAAARHAVPAPLVEHDLLARWVSEHAGIPVVGIGSGAAYQPISPRDPHVITARVPWAGLVDSLVAVWRHGDEASACVVAVDDPAATVVEGTDLSGRRVDRVRIDTHGISTPQRIDPSVAEALELRGALARAAQLTGAMASCVDLASAYAVEREQFGRPIGAHQSVQRLVVDAAVETTLAASAADAAAWEVDHGTAESSRLSAAAAVSVAWHASSVVIRNAHQVLGAMGTTAEHALQRRTRAMLAWRSDYRGGQHWDAEIAGAVEGGSAPVWSDLVPASSQVTSR